MGANGSGKSTLALLAAGIISPSSGEIVRSGDSQEPPGLVLQSPDSQLVSISIERELAFPLECRQWDFDAIHEAVDTTIAHSGFNGRRKNLPSNLSGGEKQKLALFSAMIAAPAILVLDEPTSHLDAEGKKLMWNAIDEVSKSNPDISIIVVTQSSSEALKVSRLIVVDEGRVVSDDEPRPILFNPESYAQSNLNAPPEYYVDALDVSVKENVFLGGSVPPHQVTHSPLVRLSDLTFEWEDGTKVFDDLSLTINERRVVGLAAKSGGGKTTLAHLMAGLLDPSSGTINIRDHECAVDDLLETVSYLFQFPERQVFLPTVREEVCYGLKQQGVNHRELNDGLHWALEMVGLDVASFESRSPFRLSGGELRKVALASIIALRRELTIYDEPTAELDSASREAFRRVLMSVKGDGRTQLVVSHDTNFLFDACDDILLMSNGGLVFEGDKFETIERPELYEKCGVAVPDIVSLCRRYRSAADIVVKNRIASLAELHARVK